jgi:hypothetical protein
MAQAIIAFGDIESSTALMETGAPSGNLNVALKGSRTVLVTIVLGSL